MSAMILSCRACKAQNFVSAERRAAARVPPACWKCGAALGIPDETGSGASESKQGGEEPTQTGGRRNG